MRKGITEEQARNIMGPNIIGVKELLSIQKIKLRIPNSIPAIPFSLDELKKKKDEYVLFLGVRLFEDGRGVTIRNLKTLIGVNPDINEPCFYNQDWYDKEKFVDIPMEEGWFLIRKAVYNESRAVFPHILIENYTFPSAILCTYAFFISWLSLDLKLWFHDFIWCSDTDHNGDRIYVGKYNDVDGINKNGFSIHRHLSLRQCYGCVDFSKEL